MYFMVENMNSKVFPGEETVETAGSWDMTYMQMQKLLLEFYIEACKFWQLEGRDTRHLKTT